MRLTKVDGNKTNDMDTEFILIKNKKNTMPDSGRTIYEMELHSTVIKLKGKFNTLDLIMIYL